MTPPRAFCEFPAGLASVSLRLHGGEHCRPPISRMGNKAGYAQTILAALGLTSGHGAGAYLWAEADDDVRALLRCYPDPDMLRRVAEIIRGWADEEPRALWERLRAERRARGPREDAEGMAAWMWTTATGHPGGGGFKGEFRALGPAQQAHMGPTTCAKYALAHGTDERGFPMAPQGVSRGEVADACHRLAEYGYLADGAFRKGDVESGYRDDVAAFERGFRGEPMHGAERLTERFEGMAATVAAHVVEHAGTHPGGGGFRGGHALWPNADGFYPQREEIAGRFEGMAREVAGFVTMAPWAYRDGMPDSGYAASKAVPGVWSDGAVRAPRTEHLTGGGLERVNAGMWPPVTVLPRIPEAADVAAYLGTPGDLDGVVVYMDPPYVGTTGYKATLSRDEVVRFARDYSALGAIVAVSEASPLPDLVGEGWHVAEVTGGRRGQKRTFSKQQGEFLTMNREPAHRVAVQSGLFALNGAM